MCTTNVSFKIIYTLTDESPLLSTYSLLPIILTFIKGTDIIIETKDISLAARILSNFSQNLHFEKQKSNDLYDLSQIIKIKNANIIKLPNISASLPQLKNAIQELQNCGYCIPDYIDSPKNICERNIKILYDNIKGSAVNPILRDGNSIRYVPSVIKKYLRRNFRVDYWSPASKSHVSHMNNGDFYGSEKSIIINQDGCITIVLLSKLGVKKILKRNILVNIGDVIDVACMQKELLIHFIRKQIQDAKNQQILLSVHLKSTMMKMSDPIIFGIIVNEFYGNICKKYKRYFEALNINFNNGISDLYNNMEQLPSEVQEDIKCSLKDQQTQLAMVDCDNAITTLHIPHGMIIDSSMADMIYNSGKMLGNDGKLYDTKAIIPDRCYAGMYQAVIENCKKYGAFNSNTMGSMINVGLMAQKAEEYGSNDTTFEIPYDGIIQVIDSNNLLLFENVVHAGDIWRLCQTSDAAIKHWVELACKYAESYNVPTVFWLDDQRQHDMCIIKKIKTYINNISTSSFVDITILSPMQAVLFSIKYIRSGKNVISVTGNVLRDYLTDLFPILELGSSSRTLSITRLISNGILCEAGSGGSAPKYFEKFIKHNHLSWDSLGEFFALFASFEYIFDHHGNIKAKILSDTLYQAICKLIKMNQLPSKKIGALDTRGSHFYLAVYWSEALSLQNTDKVLKNKFKNLYDALIFHEKNIMDELIHIQGRNVELGGYYNPDAKKLKQAMRPSINFNNILKLF